jgi:hypothetical protein
VLNARPLRKAIRPANPHYLLLNLTLGGRFRRRSASNNSSVGWFKRAGVLGPWGERHGSNWGDPPSPCKPGDTSRREQTGWNILANVDHAAQVSRQR